MNLRSGKVKPDYIDLDDYLDEYESPVKRSPYNTRYQVVKIKSEPTTYYEHEAAASMVPMFDGQNASRQQSTVVSKRQWIDCRPEYGDTMDIKPKIESIYIAPPPVDMEHINNRAKKIKTEVIEAEFMEYYRDQSVKGNKERRRGGRNQSPQKKAVPIRAEYALPSDATFSCYLCYKSFTHHCRLKTHMPTHTGHKSHHCDLCEKKYVTASSLNAHRRTVHFGEKPRPRAPRQRPKVVVQKVKRQENAVQVNIDAQPRSNNQINEPMAPTATVVDPEFQRKFLEFKAEPMDLDETLNLIDLEPPPVDYIPFVWEENDLEPKIPATTIFKRPSSAILKPSNKENRMKLVATPKMPKHELWQKESSDPHAYYVDIFRQPKPKRSLFAQNASSFVPLLPAKTEHDERSVELNGKQFTSIELNSRKIDQAVASSDTNSQSDGKNNKFAVEFRQIGNTEMALKRYSDALAWFSRCVCFASDKFQKSIGYWKRAQCLFNLGMYAQCRIDLLLAEQTGLPPQMKSLLERHKEACRLMLERNPPIVEVQPMLSFQPDPLFPEMANVLQINYNETYGRHIVAKEAIGVGQIVLIEKGFVYTTTEYYEKCCICLTGNTNLVPCPRCTKAMMCKRCIGRNYHSVECELQATSTVGEDNKIWLQKVVRSILNAISIFSNADQLMSFVEAAISPNENPTIPVTIPDFKSKYRAFLQLVKRPILKKKLIPIATAVQAAILKHGPLSGSTKHQRFLTHLILHHIEVISKFGTKTHDNGESGCVDISAPIASYLNHSCSPNAAKFLLGNSVIVVAMRPIEKGQQLFVSYCDVLKSNTERQQILRSKHGFPCMCERCLQTGMAAEQQLAVQPYDLIRSEMAENFVIQNFVHLASNDQYKRKEINDRVLEVLNVYGRMPWNYTLSWAYVVYSILLSHRFQKKLRY